MVLKHATLVTQTYVLILVSNRCKRFLLAIDKGFQAQIWEYIYT